MPSHPDTPEPRPELQDDFSVQVAREDELPSILGLVEACIFAMRSRGIDQWDELYPSEANFLDDIQGRGLYLVKGQNRIVACAVLNSMQEPEYASVPWRHPGERIGVVHRLMVAPDLRGKGIARTLMRFLERRAREIGYGAIRLDAFAANPEAVALYERLGYERAGVVSFRKGLFHCFEKPLDAVELE